jgi:hypothetical protein
MRPVTVEQLERWVASGATWRVVEISDRRALVDLCQCTGDLEEQRVANDPVVVQYLREHRAASA